MDRLTSQIKRQNGLFGSKWPSSMKMYVGVTDSDWYRFLSHEPREEVNFWAPGGGTKFRALQQNDLFLFKFHSPHNFIVGGGFFISFSQLPLSLAWETFGINNGAPDLQTCLTRVRKYRKTDDPDPTIGCRVLNSPFFLPKDQWIPAPASFHPNIVQGKTYSTDDPEGAALFQQVWLRLKSEAVEAPTKITTVVRAENRFGTPYLVAPRIGQGSFRVLVTEAYDRRCALTGERTLPVLDAAHIQPYASEGPHDVRNGILMRSDLHKLFDRGYLTVRPDLTIDVSPRISSEFSNGKIYYALQDKHLEVVPTRADLTPSPDFLSWHNQKIFRA